MTTTYKEDFSRNGATAQSAAALLNIFVATLRRCGKNISLLNYHRLNHVGTHDLVDYVHSCHDSPENRVTSVEVRLRRVCHKPLRPARVLARGGHPGGRAGVRHVVC